MTTLSELVAGIHSALHSYTGVQEQVTWLTTACDAAVTTLAVDGNLGQRGIAEIDDELIYVSASGPGSLTLPPFGRGYRGSTPATHALNAQVTFDPAFPRVEIVRAINQCVEGLYPNLYQVKTTGLTGQSTDLSYTLPTDVGQVLSVRARHPNDPADFLTPITRWSFEPNNPSGKVLNLYTGITPGAVIRVEYAAPFTTLTTTFAAAGLSESWADLITYCVTSRMLRFVESARVQVASVENISRSQVVQAGDAGKTANQLYAMYQTRLAEERRRLLTLTPPQQNFLPR